MFGITWMADKLAWFGAGYMFDRVQNSDDDSQQCMSEATVSLCSHVTDSLESCRPVTDHLDDNARKELCKALAKNNEVKALQNLDLGTKQSGDQVCISLLKISVTLICKFSPNVIRAATYNLLAF